MKFSNQLALWATTLLLITPILGTEVPTINYNKETDLYAVTTNEVAFVSTIAEMALVEEQIEEEKPIPIERYTTSTDLTQPCGLTAEQLNKGLLHNLKGYGGTFLRAEEEYGINAVALAAIAAHEGDWGRSSASRNKNNFFGWGPGIYFNSKADGIATVAESLFKNYLDPSGKHYNGPNLKGINVRYCTDGHEYWEWKNKVAATMNSIVKRALE